MLLTWLISMGLFPQLANVIKINIKVQLRSSSTGKWVKRWRKTGLSRYYRTVLTINYLFSGFYFLQCRKRVGLSKFCCDAITACPSKDKLKIHVLFSLRAFGQDLHPWPNVEQFDNSNLSLKQQLCFLFPPFLVRKS